MDIENKVMSFVPALIAAYSIRTGKYLYVNNSLNKLLGYSPGEFLNGGMSFVASLVHPDDAPMIFRKNSEALKVANNKKFAQKMNESFVNFEYRMKHKSGRWVWLQTSGSVFSRDKNGKVESVLNISVDITERKIAEEKLKKISHTLELQIKQRTEQISLNEKKFRSLIEHSSDAIALITKTGKVSYVSPPITRILGYRQNDFLGINGFSFVHPSDLPRATKVLSQLLLKPGTSTTVEVRVKHKNGGWIWIEVTGTNLLFDPTVGAIVANFRDLTERKQHDKWQELLGKVTDKMVASFDHSLTLGEIAKLIVPIMADYCRIVTVDERKQIQGIVVNHNDPSKISLTKDLYNNYMDKPEMTYGVGSILKKGKAEMISVVDERILKTVRRYPSIIKITKKIGLTSYMGVPLIARRKIIGAITFSSIQKDTHYSKQDLAFAEEIARRIALLIDNSRLYQDAVREIDQRKEIEKKLLMRTRQLEILSRASRDVNKILNINTIMRTLVKSAIEATDSQAGTYGIINNEKMEFVEYLSGSRVKQINISLEKGNGVSGIVRKTKKFYLSNDASRDKYMDPALQKRFGIQNFINFPVFGRDGEITACFELHNKENNEAYGKEDIEILEGLGASASIAYENTQLLNRQRELEKRKDDFISMASHELKTPLTSMKAYTQILKNRVIVTDDNEIYHFIRKVDDQILKLTRLVNELLDMSRIGNSKLQLNFESFDFNELITDIIEAMQGVTSQHIFQIKGKLKREVKADRYRIYQVITNILNNAIKYSKKGSKIIITLKEDRNSVTVGIQDFGIGISKEHQKYIFDRLYQATESKEKTYPGLGIGLFISSEIIRRHEGVMWVESRKRYGSTFYFTLPLVRLDMGQKPVLN